MPKYNWEQLRREYILSDDLTLKEFADRKNINYATLRNRSATWNAEKVTKVRRRSDKIIEHVEEKQIKSASELNNAHLEAFEKAYQSAMRVMRELTKQIDVFGNVQELCIVDHVKLGSVVKTMRMIQDGQRLSLGMDKGDGGKGDAALSLVDAITRADEGNDG